jgi:hypothetical protein
LKSIDDTNREINKEINKKQKKYWHLIKLDNASDDRIRPQDVDPDLWKRFIAFEKFEKETKLSKFVSNRNRKT